eukprot:754757-Hanusia_phi.AAC.5
MRKLQTDVLEMKEEVRRPNVDFKPHWPGPDCKDRMKSFSCKENQNITVLKQNLVRLYEEVFGIRSDLCHDNYTMILQRDAQVRENEALQKQKTTLVQEVQELKAQLNTFESDALLYWLCMC